MEEQSRLAWYQSYMATQSSTTTTTTNEVVEEYQRPTGPGAAELPLLYDPVHTSASSVILGAGETAASPIPLASPTSRRQTSLSPNAYTSGQRAAVPRGFGIASPFAPKTAAAGMSPSGKFGGAMELDDDAHVVEMIFSTLTSSFSYYTFGKVYGGGGQHAEAEPVVEVATPSDAKNFITHFTSVLTYAVAHSGLQERAATFGVQGSKAFTSEGALIRLVFEGSFDVVGVLTDITRSSFRNAHVPARSTRVLESLYGVQLNEANVGLGPKAGLTDVTTYDDFIDLRLAAMTALKLLLTLSVEAVNQRAKDHVPSATSRSASKRPASVLPLLQAAFGRCGTLKVLLSVVLQPTAPEVLRIAAIETLFVFVMHCCGTISAPTTTSSTTAAATPESIKTLLMDNYEALTKAIAVDGSKQVRCYTAAVIRQMVLLFPRHSQVAKSIPTLLRCVVQDSSLEVVALCTAAVECVVRRAATELDHTAVGGGIANVVDTLCTAMEKACSTYSVVIRMHVSHVHEQSNPNNQHRQPSAALSTTATRGEVEQLDVLDALAQLTQSVVHFALSSVSAEMQQVFRTMQLRGLLPRLAKLTRLDSITVSRMAAAALAVMVLRAPPALQIPAAIVDTQTAFPLIQGVVSRSMPTSSPSLEADDQLRQATAAYLFDVALVVCSSLLFSPAARAQWLKVLADVTVWEELFLQRLQHALSVELGQFAGIILQDESGVTMNDPNNVEWDDDMHPSPHSMRMMLDAQTIRRTGRPGSLADSLTHWRNVEVARRHPDTKRGYLCFVLMGYVLLTLKEDPLPQIPPVPQEPTPQSQEDDEEDILRHMLAHRDPHVALQAPPPAASSVYRPLFPKTSAVHSKNSLMVDASPSAPPGTTPAGKGAQQARNTAPTLKYPPRAPVPSAVDNEHYRLLYKEFHAALELTIFLSSHYQRKLLTPQEIAADNADKVGQLKKSSGGHAGRPTNPYAKPKVLNGKTLQLRAWTSAVVEEGDLFYFYIPLASANINVMEAVITKARKHQLHAKKHFVTTPQNHRERRWFLLDMHTAVIPRLIVLLQALKKLLATHNEEHVRLALQVLPSIHLKTSSGAVEKAITCANLRNVCEYVTQTFSIRMSSSTMHGGPSLGTAAGSDDGGSPPNAAMLQSFFAPLFSNVAAAKVDTSYVPPPQNAQKQLKFDLEPFDTSDTEVSDDSHGDDDDEVAQYNRAVAATQRPATAASPRGGGGGSSYTIRRMAAPGGLQPATSSASTFHNGKEDDDSDDSFELMR